MREIAVREVGGKDKDMRWRGYVHDGAYITWTAAEARKYAWGKVVLGRDRYRLNLYKEGVWPRAIPPRLDFEGFRKLMRYDYKVRALAVDLEYTRDTKYPLLVGMGALRDAGEPDLTCVIEWPSYPDKAGFSRWFCETVGRLNVIVHNWTADLPVLSTHMGLTVEGTAGVEDTILMHAALDPELPHDLEFLASLYGSYPKLKHLSKEDPILYNQGDVLETMSVYRVFRRELERTENPVYEEQSRPLIRPVWASMLRGIRVNRPVVLAWREKLVKEKEATREALGDINPQSPKQVATYLYTTKGYTSPCKLDKAGTGKDLLAELCAAHPEDTVIRAILDFRRSSKLLANYIEPFAETERVWPTQNLFAQKTGRWSTVEPALAQLPEEMRDVLAPDPGMRWIHWDWTAIEAWMAYWYCGSPVMRKFLEEGYEVHTWTACLMLGLPMPPDPTNPHTGTENEEWRKDIHWKGKDDLRRVFAKRLRYETSYGGVGTKSTAFAKSAGFDTKTVGTAIKRYLLADPAHQAWKNKIVVEASRTGQLTTWAGRVRKFHKRGAMLEGTDARSAINYLCQAGVADLFNRTVLALADLPCFRKPGTGFVWSMHDAQWWQMREEDATEDTRAHVERIVNQAITISGVERIPKAEVSYEYMGQQ